MYRYFFKLFLFESMLGSHSMHIMSDVNYLEVTFL